MKHPIRLFALLLGVLLTLSCDRADDLNEIFQGQRFKITGLTYNGTKTVKEVTQFYTSTDVYWIAFTNQTFQGTLQAGMPIEGTWSADGNNRTITFHFTSPTDANNAGELSTLIYNILRGATTYSGDKNVLKIMIDNKSFIEMSSM